MILIQIIRFIAIGFCIYSLFNQESLENPFIIEYLGFVIIGMYGASRLVSYSIFKKDSYSIKIKNSESYNFIITLIVILGITLTINYKLDFLKMTKDYTSISLIIGLIMILESLNRFKRDILFNHKVIGCRYLDRFIKWDRITNYKLTSNNIEIWSPRTNIKIPNHIFDSENSDDVISTLNDKLFRIFDGTLIAENGILKVEKTQHNNV